MYQGDPEQLGGEDELVEEADAQNKEQHLEEGHRPHPGTETFKTQQRLAGATFNRELEADQIELGRTLLMEGIDLKPEELQALYEALPQLCEGISPDFANYLRDISPRLTSLMDEVAALNTSGNNHGALMKTVDFLEKEQANIEKIPDEKIKNMLLAYIGAALNVEELHQKVTDLVKQEAIWGGIGIIPVIGSGVDIISAGRGKKPTGEILTGRQRIWYGAKGAVCAGLDIAGFVTLGGTTAASSAAKGAGAAEVAIEGGKLAATVAKFAAIMNKVKNIQGVATTMAKVGAIIGKYPKVASALVTAVEVRGKLHHAIEIGEVVHKAGKIQAKTKKIVPYRKSIDVETA